MNANRDETLLDLERTLHRSTPARVWQRVAPAAARAADRSVAVRTTRGALARWNGLPLSTRLRLMGIGLLAFAVANAVLAAVVPESSAPAFPALVWGPAALAGIALTLGSRALASAWSSRAS